MGFFKSLGNWWFPADSPATADDLFGTYHYLDKICPYKIFIPYDVWQEMHYFVKHCRTEMGGHLEVERKGDNFIVKRLYIPTQEVSGASYVPDPKGIIDISRNNPRLVSKIKGWFHSHVDYPAEWSITDEECIENNMQVFRDYCISIVMNKRMEYSIRLDIGKEQYDNLPLHILLSENRPREEYCIEELSKKVKREKLVKSVVSDVKNVVNDIVTTFRELR